MTEKEFHRELSLELKKINAAEPSNSFMLWFLKFYLSELQAANFEDVISDKPHDMSCDLVFSRNYAGKTTFYVVQSKYREVKNVDDKLPAKELKSALADFIGLLKNEEPRSNNTIFLQKSKELKEQLRNNGEVKFIYLCLCKKNTDVEATNAINAFEKLDKSKIRFEWFDIDRLRFDFIDANFKKIENPYRLESSNYAEEADIELEIVKIDNSPSFIWIDNRPHQAYTLLLRPKTIYELFERFRFGLFVKNVRNPIPHSNYNEQMAESLKHDESNFWYYNNGITAITSIIPDKLGNQSEKLSVKGLQIINGGQTAYTIYRVYEEANALKRQTLDRNVIISFRLIESSNSEFNLKITRYTNSQNTMEERNFYANDDIQIRLQRESFAFPIWYEVRTEEFRAYPETGNNTVKAVSNAEMIKPYLALFMQNPYRAIHASNMAFYKESENLNGYYDDVFHAETKYKDIYYAFNALTCLNKLYSKEVEYANSEHGKHDFSAFLSPYFRAEQSRYEDLCLLVLYLFTVQNKDKMSQRIFAAFWSTTNNLVLLQKFFLALIELSADEEQFEDEQDEEQEYADNEEDYSDFEEENNTEKAGRKTFFQLAEMYINTEKDESEEHKNNFMKLMTRLVEKNNPDKETYNNIIIYE